MSILRFFPGSNDDTNFLMRRYDYISLDYKTFNKQYIGTYGCSSEAPLRDMLSVKRAFYNTGGKQGEHFMLSLTAKQSDIPYAVYMKIAQRIVKLLGEFQCIYALHLDTDECHIHFLLNSVSFRTGKKFSMKKRELNDFMAQCNDIIHKYGFDIIKNKHVWDSDKKLRRAEGKADIDSPNTDEYVNYNAVVECDDDVDNCDKEEVLSDSLTRQQTDEPNDNSWDSNIDAQTVLNYLFEEADNYKRYNDERCYVKYLKFHEHSKKQKKKKKPKHILSDFCHDMCEESYEETTDVQYLNSSKVSDFLTKRKYINK